MEGIRSRDGRAQGLAPCRGRTRAPVAAHSAEDGTNLPTALPDPRRSSSRPCQARPGVDDPRVDTGSSFYPALIWIHAARARSNQVQRLWLPVRGVPYGPRRSPPGAASTPGSGPARNQPRARARHPVDLRQPRLPMRGLRRGAAGGEPSPAEPGSKGLVRVECARLAPPRVAARH